ncbi:MAG: alpha/beta hydrolase [Gammaproteobacteria bacterium]|nr:alpha/beta hydrolase [Gammaproteobacteria bacterium]
MPALQQWQDWGQYFEFDGHRIFYLDAAPADNDQRETVMCLHGYPTSSWDWNLVWENLRKNYRVVALDFLGFGFSDKPDHGYSIARQADIVEALLAALNINSLHIFAHDYGDTVAQELLAREKEARDLEAELSDSTSQTEQRIVTPDYPLFKSVCFLNGGLFPETHRSLLTQRIMLSSFGNLFMQLMPVFALRGRLASLFGEKTQPAAGQLDALWAAISYKEGQRVLPKLLHYIPERVEHRDRWVGILSDSSVPLRLINGAEDRVSGRHMAEYYQRVVPKPDVVMLQEVGHYPQLEAPQETWNAFHEFVRANS